MNMKSLHTQQQIEHALFKLLQKKPYTKISIAEITRKAKVSRTSFYRNYDQKDEVIAQFLFNQYHNFIADIDQHNLRTFKQQLTAYLEFFKDNPQLMKYCLMQDLKENYLIFKLNI